MKKAKLFSLFFLVIPAFLLTGCITQEDVDRAYDQGYTAGIDANPRFPYDEFEDYDERMDESFDDGYYAGYEAGLFDGYDIGYEAGDYGDPYDPPPW